MNQILATIFQVLSTTSTAVFVVGLIVFLLLYFLPTLVALTRNHKNWLPLFIINLFLGFTGLFWVLCLAWSFVFQDKPEKRATVTEAPFPVERREPRL